MREAAGRILRALAGVPDTPHRTALAFGVGVVVAFSPFLGVHFVIALAVAFLFRLNRVAVLIGTYLNNPWTLAPMYLAGTTLGCVLLGVPSDGLQAIDWELRGSAFFAHLLATLRPYLWPFVIGNTVMGVLCGAAGYALLRRVLERRAAASVATRSPAGDVS